MYTKKPQIRISLLNYSHSSTNLSFDVLYGLFGQCPFINMLTAVLCHFFGKTNHFLKCCVFGESHVMRFLVFGSSLHCAGKCMAKLYETYIAGAWQSLRKK